LLACFDRYGVALDNFAVENISLPEELQKAIDTRISMGMVGDMAKYTQYQVATSIPLAAQNEGGLAGTGASLAAGVAMGQAMTEGLKAAQVGSVSSAPAQSEGPEVRLEKLKAMLDKGLITQADYDTAKADILKKLVG